MQTQRSGLINISFDLDRRKRPQAGDRLDRLESNFKVLSRRLAQIHDQTAKTTPSNSTRKIYPPNVPSNIGF